MTTILRPFHRRCAGFLVLGAVGSTQFSAWAASPPVVSSVSAAQRPGTKLVDIHYNLADPDSSAISISILVSQDAGVTFNVPANTFTGDYGASIAPGTGKAIVWNAGADWNGQYTATCRVRVIANDANPEGFVNIPTDDHFVMGDTLDGLADAPVHWVANYGFSMEKSLVTGARWNAVYHWALVHGYDFEYNGMGFSKAPDHPAQQITWFNAVKWCNARSEMEGLTPIYYTDDARANVYKFGNVVPFMGVPDGTGHYVGSGYRLPTEAEWEKAARGGQIGKRFPWGDTITHNQANYKSDASLPYDTSPTRGYHPAFAAGNEPYTSPVASFAPNGYGLNDMAGNVSQWCWDWYNPSYYVPSNGELAPLGPGSGTERVMRGGSFGDDAGRLRCAARGHEFPTVDDFFVFFTSNVGLRCVRGLAL